MRYQGRITTWKDDKGFGFITPNGVGEQVFVHISSFSNRQRRPGGNDIVTYELKVDGKGRSQANAVAFVGERPTPSSPPGRSNIHPIFAVCFLFFVIAAVFAGRLPFAVLVLYIVASVVAFFRLRIRQVSRLTEPMANPRKYVASVRPSRWLAWRFGCTTAASAQVGKGILSGHFLDHCCDQLRSTRLVVFAFWRENASLHVWCRVRANEPLCSADPLVLGDQMLSSKLGEIVMHPDTKNYNEAQAPTDQKICDLLALEIERNIPEAENKIWHAHPVWFLDGNPIVGYGKLKNCVRLLFWSGQSFEEEGLKKEGSFKAAEARYTAADQIDTEKLGRWLAEARDIQWDYRNLIRRKGRLERLK